MARGNWSKIRRYVGETCPHYGKRWRNFFRTTDSSAKTFASTSSPDSAVARTVSNAVSTGSFTTRMASAASRLCFQENSAPKAAKHSTTSVVAPDEVGVEMPKSTTFSRETEWPVSSKISFTTVATDVIHGSTSPATFSSTYRLMGIRYCQIRRASPSFVIGNAVTIFGFPSRTAISYSKPRPERGFTESETSETCEPFASVFLHSNSNGTSEGGTSGDALLFIWERI